MFWMFWITTTCTTSTCSPSSFFFLFKLVFAVLPVYLYIACQCRGIRQTRHVTSHTVPPPLFTFHGSVSLGLLLFSTSRIKAKKNVMTKRNKSALFLLGTWEWGGRGIDFFTFFLLRCALMRTMRSMRALWIVFETMWPSDTCDEAGLLFVCKDRVRRLCEWLTLWATVLAPVALLARRCRVRYAGPWPTLWYY